MLPHHDFHLSDDFFVGSDGTKQMHLAEGDLIRALQADRGFTQDDLVKRTGLCKRTVRHMVRYERLVKLWEIARVAQVLQVPLEAIKGQSAASLQIEYQWEDLPVPVKRPLVVRRALRLDMNSDFDGALDVLQGGLKELDPANPHDLRDWAFYCLKRDSIRSNAGRNSEALDGIDGILDAHGRRLSPRSKLLGLLQFHRGVILRRLDRLDEAAALFGDLQHRKICAPGAWHQLGVLGLLDAGSNVNSPTFDAAQRFLTKSREDWAKGRGTYRAGFSEYRLGQAYQALGDRQRAAESFYSACVRFEQNGCTRYLVASRKACDGLSWRRRG